MSWVAIPWFSSGGCPEWAAWLDSIGLIVGLPLVAFHGMYGAHAQRRSTVRYLLGGAVFSLLLTALVASFLLGTFVFGAAGQLLAEYLLNAIVHLEEGSRLAEAVGRVAFHLGMNGLVVPTTNGIVRLSARVAGVPAGYQRTWWATVAWLNVLAVLLGLRKDA